ncbi:glycoside hydrolase family 3 N-terminal domain-containing protein [Oceanicaulis alexandrii]|uniref:glycoside hydrolase family 3 N-terminal domain-containing protein n=1 Tax=Oceanicaulis alexandrii TaxID=153233 RepID=UPI0023558BE4|nr:glycoside hydrolase family 3 N-terminal domain-containing protein [Oceanicaulis alexandrii]
MMISRRGLMAGMAALCTAPAFAAQASLDALVGNCLILGFLGDHAQAEGAARLEADLAAGRVGGALFLRHNARSRDGVLGLSQRFQSAAPNAWLAIDQEGGFVQRLTDEMGFTDIPTAEALAEMGLDAARPVFAQAARELAQSGFSMNLAPVADLRHEGNQVIDRWARAFGDDPDTVAAFCGAFIEEMEAEGVACAIKHFPGHGRSQGDSHDGFVDISQTWGEVEAAPFERLIEQDKAHLIMGGHLINRRLDPSGRPVTLSRPVLQGLLREQMGYRGAVITDDLDMGAIRNQYSREQAIVDSLAAGNDLLLISNSADADPDLPRRAVDWVGQAIEDGRLSLERLVDANARIAALKMQVRRA